MFLANKGFLSHLRKSKLRLPQEVYDIDLPDMPSPITHLRHWLCCYTSSHVSSLPSAHPLPQSQGCAAKIWVVQVSYIEGRVDGCHFVQPHRQWWNLTSQTRYYRGSTWYQHSPEPIGWVGAYNKNRRCRWDNLVIRIIIGFILHSH